MPKPVAKKEVWADAAILFPPYSTLIRELHNNMESMRSVVKPRLQDDWGTNNWTAKKKNKKNVVKVMKKKKVVKVMKVTKVVKVMKKKNVVKVVKAMKRK